MKRLLILSFVCFLVGSACTRDKETISPVGTLKGEWVNEIDSADRLTFQEEVFYRSEYQVVLSAGKHRYKYSVADNYITVQYSGPNYILVPEKKLRYSVSTDHDRLVMEGFGGYFPLKKGDIFIRVK